MNYDDLNDEVKARLKGCETPEELLALAKEEGYELSDEELAEVSGGANDWANGKIDTCVKCGSHNLKKVHEGYFECLDCGYANVAL